jgi:hypothetical protein
MFLENVTFTPKLIDEEKKQKGNETKRKEINHNHLINTAEKISSLNFKSTRKMYLLALVWFLECGFEWGSSHMVG